MNIEKQITWAKDHPVWILAATLAVLTLALVLGGAIFSSIGHYWTNSQIQKLEKEKQASETRAKDAENKTLILQGEVNAKDQQIESLNDAISKSNQRVTTADQSSAKAKAKVDQVRTSGPSFVATSDAGKVAELKSELCGLYPDAESCH